MNEDKKVKILSRIRKMLNLANDSAATEGERDNSMRAVHATLAKYNLSMAEAETHGDFSEEKRIKNEHETQNYAWIRFVGMGVGELLFCKYFYSTSRDGNKNRHCFIGRESNVETAREMLSYLTKSVWKEANAGQAKNQRDRHYWTSFCNGASRRIYSRCEKLREEAEATNIDNIPGTALVLASFYKTELQANELFLKNQEISVTPTAIRTKSRSHGYHEGSAYGNSVGLNRQIGESESGVKRLK